MGTYTIAEIESAINFWRNHEAPTEAFGLCKPARVLADLYGMMIFKHSESVTHIDLSKEQNEALIVALNPEK